MAFKRKTSKVLIEAQTRLANMQGIDPNLDLGNGLTLAAFADEIAANQQELDEYNAQLAKADAAGNNFKEGEKRVRTKSCRRSSLCLGRFIKF
ncbi:MAG: hypothetical protein D3916_07275 [Candidatus Electrothrix sp. MAN1_4]|nr:hypothetical protein [Candidatus Electrothrix sp. MAN1_4]